MARMFYDEDANLSYLEGKKVAVLGYGSQGHAQAQNLKDSGVDVIIGLRKGSPSWSKAEGDGFEVYTVAEAVKKAEIIQILLPDEKQAQVYSAEIEAGLEEGNTLVFSHGFNIHFGQIKPPAGIDVFMIAPKGPGHLVRRLYKEGTGIPGLIAIHQDASGKAMDVALAFAKGIGCTRAGLLLTTFQEETETDLFGEQTVLCGGLTELIRAGYDILVEAGYQPESAYFEVCHELKLIVDLIYEGGIAGMRYSISDTAEFGDMMIGPRIITEDTRNEMRKVLKEIQNGTFARAWILENQTGRARYNAQKRIDAEHPVEKVGKELRSRMPWLKKNK